MLNLPDPRQPWPGTFYLEIWYKRTIMSEAPVCSTDCQVPTDKPDKLTRVRTEVCCEFRIMINKLSHTFSTCKSTYSRAECTSCSTASFKLSSMSQLSCHQQSILQLPLLGDFLEIIWMLLLVYKWTLLQCFIHFQHNQSSKSTYRQSSSPKGPVAS